MASRSFIFKRLLAYKKVLDVPAEAQPRITKSAEEVGKSVVIMAGVIWAAFLAAYMAATDEDLKDALAISMNVALWLFLLSAMIQILHASFARKAFDHAAYWVWYIGLGATSISLLVFSGGFLSAFQAYQKSDERAQLEKIHTCLQAKSAEADKKQKRFAEDRSYHRACEDLAGSDMLALELALAEGRITKQQIDVLAKGIEARCSMKELDNDLVALKTLAAKNCDPDGFLGK